MNANVPWQMDLNKGKLSSVGMRTTALVNQEVIWDRTIFLAAGKKMKGGCMFMALGVLDLDSKLEILKKMENPTGNLIFCWCPSHPDPLLTLLQFWPNTEIPKLLSALNPMLFNPNPKTKIIPLLCRGAFSSLIQSCSQPSSKYKTLASFSTNAALIKKILGQSSDVKKGKKHLEQMPSVGIPQLLANGWAARNFQESKEPCLEIEAREVLVGQYQQRCLLLFFHVSQCQLF